MWDLKDIDCTQLILELLAKICHKRNEYDFKGKNQTRARHARDLKASFLLFKDSQKMYDV